MRHAAILHLRSNYRDGVVLPVCLPFYNFSSVQDGVGALGKAPVRSTLSPCRKTGLCLVESRSCDVCVDVGVGVARSTATRSCLPISFQNVDGMGRFLLICIYSYFYSAHLCAIGWSF